MERLVHAPCEDVWAELGRIERHVRWMADAVAIRFLGDRREGVGAVFVCDTRVGPFRMRDRMEVTEWAPPHAMGVRHIGAVRGEGRFTLREVPGGTLVGWAERLRFPWWLGGPLGARVARPVLRRIWLANLARLAAIVAADR